MVKVDFRKMLLGLVSLGFLLAAGVSYADSCNRECDHMYDSCFNAANNYSKYDDSTVDHKIAGCKTDRHECKADCGMTKSACERSCDSIYDSCFNSANDHTKYDNSEVDNRIYNCKKSKRSCKQGC